MIISWTGRMTDMLLIYAKGQFYSYSTECQKQSAASMAATFLFMARASMRKVRSYMLTAKRYHSINCQISYDSFLRIYDLSPKWSGNSHDAFILKNSNVWVRFTENHMGWLVANSADPFVPWLTQSPGKRVVITELIRKGRSTERSKLSFGALQSRWCFHLRIPQEKDLILLVVFFTISQSIDKFTRNSRKAMLLVMLILETN